MYAAYEKLSKHPFENAIKSEMSGNIATALLAIGKWKVQVNQMLQKYVMLKSQSRKQYIVFPTIGKLKIHDWKCTK